MVSATPRANTATDTRTVSRSSSALWCLRPVMDVKFVGGVAFLGALLLCGVCDDLEVRCEIIGRVSRSSSALWCLRRPSRADYHQQASF